jgi:ATP synthase protein I
MERNPPPPFRDLDKRLREAQARKPRDTGKVASTGVGLAFRIGTELVAGLAVGVAIGWLLDDWLGTKPWLMVLFFFLGAGAGILNVYRSVRGYGLAVGYRKPDAKDDNEGGDK